MKSFSKYKKKILSNSNINKLFYIFLITIFIINTLWIVLDNYAPRGNGKEFVLELAEIHGMNTLDKINYLLFSKQYKYQVQPPFVELTFIPYYALFGFYTKNELVINSFYLLILILSVYKIGERIYNKKIGFLASIIMSSFPVIISLSKMTYREFHLLSFVALSFWCMLKTDYYTKSKESTVFGLVLGITLLIRYDAAVYLVPQVVVYSIFSLYKFLISYQKHKSHHNIVLINIFLVVLLVLLIAGWWYNKNLDTLQERTKKRIFENENEIAKKKFVSFSRENLFYYLDILIITNLGVIFGVFFIFSIIYKFFNKPSFEESLLIIVFLFNYLIFTFIPIKAYTKMIPSYFVIPILVAGILTNLKIKKVVKSVFITGVIIYCFSILFSPVFNTGILVFENNQFNLIKTHEHPFFRELQPPSKEPSIGEKIFFLIKDITIDKQNIDLLLLSNDHGDYWDIIYFCKIYNFNCRIMTEFKFREGYYLKWSNPGNFNPNFNTINIIQNKKAHFIVVFLPNYNSSKTEETFKPSYNAMQIIALNENYEAIKEIEGVEEQKELAIIYKLKSNNY